MIGDSFGFEEGKYGEEAKVWGESGGGVKKIVALRLVLG